MVNEIKNVEDFVKAIGDEKTGLVVIDFYTKWCGPCQMIAPFIVELSKKYPNASFKKINCENPDVLEIADKCEIRAFPTFCFFNGGQYIDSIRGANKQLLEQKIVQYLTTKSQDEPATANSPQHTESATN